MLSKKFRHILGLIKRPNWQPLQDIGRPPVKSFNWQAIGPEPQLTCSTRYWLPGWYMLELAIEHDQPTALAKLGFDTGKGFSDEQSITLVLPQKKIIKRIIYLPVAVRQLRLQPLSSKGSFTLQCCNFVWLHPNFAYHRLTTRLSKMHTDYKALPANLLLEKLKEQAKAQQTSWRILAMQAYDDTFHYLALAENYQEWLEQLFPLAQQENIQLQQQSQHWLVQPVISILLPVYNTPAALLYECVQSVKQQLYPHWQLCIADDASTCEHTLAALTELASSDSRIKVKYREQNGHISAASNTALAMASGDYIALLDHDDLLTPDALLHMVAAINKQPNALLLYSDEDKLNGQGERYDPHFKPDWNPDLLLSQNYISHLVVYQTQRVRDIGGFREGLEGSQDHDLVLRFTSGLTASHIVHIPKVLYHWRAVAGSTALTGEEKHYTQAAGEQAIAEYVQVMTPLAQVEAGIAANSYRVRWPLPANLPLISLLVPTRDGIDILQPCIDAILEKTDYQHFELLILDNQSSCPLTLAYLQQVCARDQRVRVLHWDQPFNYSAINNFGVSQAKGSIIGLVNNDIEPINAGWLTEMVSQVCRPEIGCVGAKLYYPNGTLQHGGVILGLGGVAGHSHKHFARPQPGYFYRLQLVQNFSAVTAACLLVRKDVFEQVGGLNEEHLKVAFNDVDFCLKVREAGYRNLWTPYAELYHHESVSRGAEDNPEKQARFQSEIDYMRKTWGPMLDNDPAYNPNLTLAYEDFSLRCPSVSTHQ